MNATPPPPLDLAAARAEIDRLDTAIHDLVMQRAAVVGRMAAGRAKGDGPALRPAREAQILRRLLARHAGPFPRDALVQVWRALINGHTAMQGAFSVAVFNTTPGSGFVALAREHFGATTPVRAATSPAQVLAALSRGEASAGVLPLPAEEGEAHTWWTALLARDEPRVHVVGRLPFWTRRPDGAPRVEALVVGVMPPEPTGLDRTLIVCEATDDLSRTRIAAALDAAGLTPRASFVRRPVNDVAALLVEADGFVAETDPRLAAFAERAGARRPVIAGAYPLPLEETSP
jgi:chorismate mutase